jgi:hypothetical protein
LDSEERYRTVDFKAGGGGGGGGARQSIPESHVARTVLQVRDRVHLGVQRNSGNCDHRELSGSRQEVGDRTRNLCEIIRVRQCNGLRYSYLHSVRPQ